MWHFIHFWAVSLSFSHALIHNSLLPFFVVHIDWWAFSSRVSGWACVFFLRFGVFSMVFPCIFGFFTSSENIFRWVVTTLCAYLLILDLTCGNTEALLCRQCAPVALVMIRRIVQGTLESEMYKKSFVYNLVIIVQNKKMYWIHIYIYICVSN